MRIPVLLLSAALVTVTLPASPAAASSVPASPAAASSLTSSSVPALTAAASSRAASSAPASFLAAPSPSSAAGCSWVPLAAPAGLTDPRVVAAAGDGVYAGTATSGRSVAAVLWTSGTARNLGLPFGHGAEVFDVNASGTVVGRAGDVPVRFQHGRWENLPVPAGARGAATDINAAGDVFGSVDLTRLILWPAARPGTFEIVSTPFPGYIEADDLADDGTLLITAHDAVDTGPVSARRETGAIGPVSARRETDGTGPVSARRETGGIGPVSAHRETDGTGPVSARRETDGTWTMLPRADPAVPTWSTAAAGDHVAAETSDGGVILWDRAAHITHAWPGAAATDLNAAGEVLDGWARSGPAIWRNGKVEHRLPSTFAGARAVGVALDDNGTVLGQATASAYPFTSTALLGHC